MISANWATSPYPVYPIGMSMVAAALRRAGHDVELFDFLQAGRSLPAAQARVESVAPDVVGISIRNVDNVNAAHEQRYIDTVRKLVECVRAATSAPVVLGGSGFSIMPDEILAKTGADYGIVGEGEALMPELLELLAAGREPPERVLHAPLKLERDAIPPADYDAELLDFYLESGRVVSIQTKRGCNKRCVYCSYPSLEGRRFRVRNPSAVVDDVERLLERLSAEQIFFVDSLFNDNEGHYRAVVAEMARRELCVPWTAFFSPGGDLDDETIAMMKATGLDAAEIGADATTDATLRGIGKDFLWEDVVRCNERFRRHDVTTAHYYMFGGPGETPETVEEGIRNVLDLKETANFMFLGIRVLPGTPLMELARREGIVTAETDVVEPVYYFSPHVDRDRLERRLTEGFADRFNCVFPPDALDDKLHLLHKLGIGGSAYDLLVRAGSGTRRRRRRS